jgi:hypothetical protein
MDWITFARQAFHISPCPTVFEERWGRSGARVAISTKFLPGTRQQWGVGRGVEAVRGRILRTNCDDRYFTDDYQLMPAEGYTRMFERMLDHPRIEVLVDTDFHDVAGDLHHRHLIYTGPIDRFFGFRYGQLPYRSLRFAFEHHAGEYVLPVGQINYPGKQEFTRVTESKRLTGQKCSGTTLTFEYPTAPGHDADDRYYPVPTDANQALYARYRRDAKLLPDVTFCGRLAEYRYHNMDQVVARSLSLFEHRIAGARTRTARCPPSRDKRCRLAKRYVHLPEDDVHNDGLKRLFDVVLAGGTLLVASPVFLLTSILVRLSSPGPVLYRKLVYGRRGCTIQMLKFRTMYRDADQRLKELLAEDLLC